MIYDCFTFYNELQILDIRLNTLKDFVDKFVIVEAGQTFAGKQKQFYFENNRNLFSDFLDRIIYVKIDRFPSNLRGRWEKEHFQRNQIMKGLKACNEEDIILISDVDEIPNLQSIRNIHTDTIKIFSQRFFSWYFNYMVFIGPKEYRWLGTVMSKFKEIDTPQNMRNIVISRRDLSNISEFPELLATPSILYLPRVIQSQIIYYIRAIRKKKNVEIIENGGQHFSSIGNLDFIVNKVATTPHKEFSKEKYMTIDYVKMKIERGEFIEGTKSRLEKVEIDDTFPVYLRENLEKFKDLIRL